MPIDFETLTFKDVFKMYAQIRAWARQRKLWGQGNIVGSYTEYLVAQTLGLKLKPPSTPGYDATDEKEKKYQIKGLFDSENLWAGWESEEKLRAFDYLVCVIFNQFGEVLRGHVLPSSVTVDAAVFGAQNMWWIYFKDELWNRKRVIDITQQLRNITF